MKSILLAVVFAAGAALTLASSASALPAAGANNSALQSHAVKGTAVPVHYRKWRHSHRNSYRLGRANRGYGYRNYSNRGTGIYLNFGGSRYGNRRYGNYRGYDRGYW